MKRSSMPTIGAAALAAMAAGVPTAVLSMPRNDASGGVEKLLGEVKQQMARLGEEIKPLAEQALREAKQAGEVSGEVKAASDKALMQYHELGKAQSKLEGQLQSLETRSLEIEQLIARGGGGRGGARQTVGQELATSDQLKAYVQGGCQGNLTLRPSQAITSAGGSGGGLIWPDQEREPVNMARQSLSIRSLLMQATTGTDVVKYSRQTTRTNATAMVAEGASAPVSTYGWTQAEVNVRKIAHVAHASDEALADAGQLAGLIDGEMRYGLDLEEDAQILAGDGTGQNLSGLITEATAFSAAAGLPNETRIDRLRLGLLQVALANFSANGITLHPSDWAGIDLQKDENKRYIFGNPSGQSTPRLWGLDVVPTMSHSVGEWMVGSFMMAATIYDREQAEVLISSEHGTNFVDGMKTIKALKRLALAIKRPAALVTGNFTFA